MIHNPELRRLRHNVFRQREMSDAMASARVAWSARPDVFQVLEDLGHFGTGAHLAQLPSLSRLFAEPGAAAALAQGWVCAVGNALAREPLAQPGFRHQASRGATVMLLSKRGDAELALVCYDGANGPGLGPVTSGFFAPVERHEAFLAGSARLLLVRRDDPVVGPDSFLFERLDVREGAILSQTGSRVTKAFEHIEGRLVVLRLSRPDAAGGPVQEYRLADGALIHQSSSNKHESCQEMMMAVLGRMGRVDAVPAMERLARSGNEHLRWQALRHCLALSPAKGFRSLAQIACSAGDPLAIPAGALRAQLVEAYPELAKQESEPCLVS